MDQYISTHLTSLTSALPQNASSVSQQKDYHLQYG